MPSSSQKKGTYEGRRFGLALTVPFVRVDDVIAANPLIYDDIIYLYTGKSSKKTAPRKVINYEVLPWPTEIRKQNSESAPRIPGPPPKLQPFP